MYSSLSYFLLDISIPGVKITPAAEVAVKR
jgi:hypothetical protein